MKSLAVTFSLLLVLTACEHFAPPGRSRDASPTQETPTGATANEQISNRFKVLYGSTLLSSDQETPIILRIDSTTGETWALDVESNRWVGVEDELRRAGTYNPETQEIEWGVELPDGRDLNELSREELIRYLSAAILNGASPDPNDPLGIRGTPQ